MLATEIDGSIICPSGNNLMAAGFSGRNSLGSSRKRRMCSLMGNSQGRDNVKKRAARRKKTERLAAAKKSSSSKEATK